MRFCSLGNDRGVSGDRTRPKRADDGNDDDGRVTPGWTNLPPPLSPVAYLLLSMARGLCDRPDFFRGLDGAAFTFSVVSDDIPRAIREVASTSSTGRSLSRIRRHGRVGQGSGRAARTGLLSFFVSRRSTKAPKLDMYSEGPSICNCPSGRPGACLPAAPRRPLPCFSCRCPFSLLRYLCRICCYGSPTRAPS